MLLQQIKQDNFIYHQTHKVVAFAWGNVFWDNPEFVNLDAGVYNSGNNTHISWNFKTAAGFFDIVTWAGNLQQIEYLLIILELNQNL